MAYFALYHAEKLLEVLVLYIFFRLFTKSTQILLILKAYKEEFVL